MSEKYTPAVGDRVRVVLEGEVTGLQEAAGNFYLGHDAPVFLGLVRRAELVVSIEKIEPPVEVFKPGDVVRRKGESRGGGWGHYTLAEGGYLSHKTGNFNPYALRTTKASHFSSELYEKVSVG